MRFIITILLILFTIISFAQKIEVEAIKYNYESGEKFALSVNIHSDDIKDVMKAFKKEAEKDAGVIVEKKKELFLDNTIINEISDSKIDVYATVKKAKDGTSKLIASFEVNNEYIIPKSEAYKNAEKFMKKLAREISIIVIKKEIEKEGKILSDIEQKIQNKKDKNSNLEEDIKKRENNIEKDNKELKDVSSELKGIKKDINNGKGKLEKLAKEKEKFDKKHEKLAKHISRDEGEIKSSKKKIEKNKKDIEDLEKKKSDQEKVLEKIKGKLATVK